jgi:biopolymer transport protein ExbD
MEAPKTQAITIDSSGSIKLNTVPVTLSDLESKLGQLKATNPELPVVVRGDRTNQYQLIMDVLDVLGRTGITQIGLATQPPK